VQAMGMSGISKSQVSRLCGEIDGKIDGFLERPLEGDWPYLWLDATYVKVRQDGRIVPVAVSRNLLADAGKQARRVVSALVAIAFAQDAADSARTQWYLVADQLRPKVPKLAALMDVPEHDVLAYMIFPREHRRTLRSTNPLERLNAEIKRRTNVVGDRRAVLPTEGPLLPPHSPTRWPSPAWSAPSFSNRTMNGPSQGGK